MNQKIPKLPKAILCFGWLVMLFCIVFSIYSFSKSIWAVTGFVNEPPIIIWSAITHIVSQIPALAWIWNIGIKGKMYSSSFKSIVLIIICFFAGLFITIIFVFLGVPKLFWNIYGSIA